MMFYIGLVLGLLTGVGLAVNLVSFWVKCSNDIGDSTGKLEDFGRVTVLYAKKGIKEKNFEKTRAQVNGVEELRKRRHKMVMKVREQQEKNT
ncbi:MAG: hypothetical protein IKX10_00750 [Lachnospiraceae bacterium]|nr:hypothetical protein [Lachnospiraceae bacterium]